MAKVTNYINNLKTICNTGHHARTLMVYILQNVQEDGPDARTFDGHRASEYADKSYLEIEMDKIRLTVNRDDTPSKYSENLLMSKGIMKLLGALEEYPDHD